MRDFCFGVILLLGVLALVSGAPFALTVPAVMVNEPCPHPHEHQRSQGQHTGHQHSGSHSQHKPAPQHDHGMAVPMCCCVGICVAMPDLVQGQAVTAPTVVSPVRYWDSNTRLTSRSIEPDPTPPRRTA